MGSGQSAEEVGGYRVFKVHAGSPAEEAGLEVFFDFVTEIGGKKMDSDQASFYQSIQEAVDQRTKMVVHNIRTNIVRDVFVTPRKWTGVGLLGAMVRYDTLDSAESQGIRVLSVFDNSPARSAGLVPYKDFLLGTTEVMFRDLDELVEIVNLFDGRKVQVYVYNSDSEAIREVTLVPDSKWGGNGCIGADIRTGLLHRIPPPRKNAALYTAQATPPHLQQQQQQQQPQQPHALQSALSPLAAQTQPAALPDATQLAHLAQPLPTRPEQPNEAAAVQPPDAVPESTSVEPYVASTARELSTPAVGSAATPSGSPSGEVRKADSTPPGALPAGQVQEALTALAAVRNAEVQAESPQRVLTSPAADLGTPTPAAVEHPKAPPSTPLSKIEASQHQDDRFHVMSPNIVHVPAAVHGGPSGLPGFPIPVTLLPGQSSSPGVIHEMHPQPAAAVI